MAEHKHGSMNIEEQENTFNGFIKFVMYGAILSIGVLLFMAIFNS